MAAEVAGHDRLGSALRTGTDETVLLLPSLHARCLRARGSVVIRNRNARVSWMWGGGVCNHLGRPPSFIWAVDGIGR